MSSHMQILISRGHHAKVGDAALDELFVHEMLVVRFGRFPIAWAMGKMPTHCKPYFSSNGLDVTLSGHGIATDSFKVELPEMVALPSELLGGVLRFAMPPLVNTWSPCEQY